jgi:hypothetical protein
MARHRQPDAKPAVDDGIVPDELRLCFVEDWVERGEDGADPQVAAWRHWKDARTAWQETHGLTPGELMALAPMGRPRFRDREKYHRRPSRTRRSLRNRMKGVRHR